MSYTRVKPLSKGSTPHLFWRYLKARELSNTLDLEALSGLDIQVLSQEWRIRELGEKRPFSAQEERQLTHVAAQMKWGGWVSVER